MQRITTRLALVVACHWYVATMDVRGQPSAAATPTGDAMLAAYFRQEVDALSEQCLADASSLEEWEARREVYRGQLLEMLGLDPWPDKTDLQPQVTATTTRDDFVVERLHFQSRPGLYVTANLYRPKTVSGPLPAVLYVCGHGRVAKDGVSYGNKVHYHHHGCWLARHGYVCLMIDTLQLGEIEGIHHGTYRENMWWWLNRGYTPAGVEAWNCVRAIDYLLTRPEVDPERIGVTGRSGGGAYSWWIAAIDDRIRCAVPVAGITDLQNHVVDGCVEGHCDCMFIVNTHRWDYPLVAALVAPRPLLISNSDSDGIFPLDGVYRTFVKVRAIYKLYGAADKVALNITAGPHQDTQQLRVSAFHWLNHYLKGDDGLIDRPATSELEPEELRVFEQLPDDEQNTTIQETFVAAAEPRLPRDAQDWSQLRGDWRQALSTKVFAGWPREGAPLDVREAWQLEHDGLVLKALDFHSQPSIPLRLYLLHESGLQSAEVLTLHVLDQGDWDEFVARMRPAFAAAFADEPPAAVDEQAWGRIRDELASSTRSSGVVGFIAPRGVGPTAWNQDAKKQTQIRRRFYLIGQTLDGMRVYDVRRAIQAYRTQPMLAETPLILEARERMAGVALYASLFEPDVAGLHLIELPATHRDGPFLLNVRRFLDLPQVVAMAAENSSVVLSQSGSTVWDYPLTVARTLHWDGDAIQVRAPETSADGAPAESN